MTLRLKKEGVSWRQIEDEVVGVDVPTSTYFSTNESGVILWKALAGGTTRDELVARLTDEFGIEVERAGADVDRFLADLDARGLLER